LKQDVKNMLALHPNSDRN